jgi:Holliday junction resolvase RusA-like endonuclease
MLTIRLPFPPSANRLWRAGKTKGKFYIDPSYAAWRLEAQRAFLMQKRELGPSVHGGFQAFITLDEKKRKKASDADNRVKAVLDFLQKMELIKNDKDADRVCVSWGPVDGCSVTVFDSKAPTAQIENILWG